LQQLTRLKHPLIKSMILPGKVTNTLLSVFLTISVNNTFAQKSHSISNNPTTINSAGIKMVKIQPGTFKMGAVNTQFKLGKKTDYSKDAPYYDETPVHQVTISYPFYISETEVKRKTNGNLK